MLFLFFLCGLVLTFRTGFIQFKAPLLLWRSLRERKKDRRQSGLSPFEALCAALAGTVGTGNIAGVALALVSGGPGAVFWLWVSAFLGMATKYTEISLSLRYRVRDAEGAFRGGPMYYIKGALGRKWLPLAYVFSASGVAASFGIGNLAQCREISGAAEELFGLSPAVCGFLLSALCIYIVCGGVERLGKLSSALVPVMSLLYLGAGLVLILLRADSLPQVLGDIFSQAFSGRSAMGGTAGYSFGELIRQGFARGIFSNEAGLGSSPIAHAASGEEKGENQAILGVFEVFISSIVFCTVTALAILLSGTGDSLSAESAGGSIAAAAFNAVLPYGTGGLIISLSLIFFAFSSLVSWSYYGRCCLSFFDLPENADGIYCFCFALCCTIGALCPGGMVWELSDALNTLMAVPNLIALLAITSKSRPD